MKFTRQRYQRGYLRRVPRANNKSAWEYRYADPQTGKEKSMYFSTEQFPTQTAVERHLETFVLKLNTDNPTLALLEPTFDTLLDRFIEEERLLEIKKVRPGESCDNVGELSFSTASSYLSVIKRVRAKWGTTRITRLKPMNVQEWLRTWKPRPKPKVTSRPSYIACMRKLCCGRWSSGNGIQWSLSKSRASANAGNDR